MKKLRTYYERELGTLLGFNQEFAAQFPAQARQLGMPDGAADDPHIERFIQASALSNARIAKLIDDNDAKVTEALLSVNYPHYLQPFPASSIVGVDLGAGVDTMTTVGTIPRGTMMSAKSQDGAPCAFQTIFDVQLTPLVLSRLAFHPIIDLPPSMPRPATVTSSLSIAIECKAGTVGLKQLGLNAWRLFIDAEQSLSATTRDVLFMHAKTAYIELAGGEWIALETMPIRPVGFEPEQALVPAKASSHPAYRLLTEYFAFPEKFNFFDIDWPSLARHLPADCRKLTLHLGLSGIPADSSVARSLGSLSNKNFVPGCTPVVNLFKRSACPIEWNHTATDYELAPDASPASDYDIHSVDKVYAIRDSAGGPALTEFRPYYSLRHGEGRGQRGHYYLLRRDPIRALSNPGHDMRIALIDLDLDPLAMADASVSIDLTCTNRNLPSRLRYGAAGGDLELEQATGGFPLRFLRKPTPQYRFSADAHWRLISHLALSHCSLVQDGLNNLTEMLTLYDLPQSAVSQRQIGGITGLEHRPARAWLRDGAHSALVRGIEVRLTLDEEAFAGTGMHLFAQVLDRFFGLYVHLNSFSQLTILSHSSGKELIRCPPRNGAINLV
ncbi:MAG TPA: type VI secretion system baseplate subunit TssF [Janthinobacterium sp.]|nr:type VI secretion system baseplate subunit TssF [Janthinobacterium sp.]